MRHWSGRRFLSSNAGGRLPSVSFRHVPKPLFFRGNSANFHHPHSLVRLRCAGRFHRLIVRTRSRYRSQIRKRKPACHLRHRRRHQWSPELHCCQQHLQRHESSTANGLRSLDRLSGLGLSQQHDCSDRSDRLRVDPFYLRCIDCCSTPSQEQLTSSLVLQLPTKSLIAPDAGDQNSVAFFSTPGSLNFAAPLLFLGLGHTVFDS